LSPNSANATIANVDSIGSKSNTMFLPSTLMKAFAGSLTEFLL
jgi:hypothetical protein